MFPTNRGASDSDGADRQQPAWGRIAVLVVAVLALVAAGPVALSSVGSPATAPESSAIDTKENSSVTPAGQSATTLSLADAKGEVGSSVVVELRTDNPDVAGYSVDVRYDPDAVTVEEITPTELNGQIVANHDEGQTRVVAAAAQPVGNESAVLAELHVEPETESEHMIALEPESYVTNDSGVQIEPTISNATLSVGADDDGGFSPPGSTDDHDDETDDGGVSDDSIQDPPPEDTLPEGNGGKPSSDPDPGVETDEYNGTEPDEERTYSTDDEMPLVGAGSVLGPVVVVLGWVLYRRQSEPGA